LPGQVLGDVEAFGSRTAMTSFGSALGAILASRKRFNPSPRVVRPAGDGSLCHALVDGLVAGGLKIVA
jgi:hypothetical protein